MIDDTDAQAQSHAPAAAPTLGAATVTPPRKVSHSSSSFARSGDGGGASGSASGSPALSGRRRRRSIVVTVESDDARKRRFRRRKTSSSRQVLPGSANGFDSRSRGGSKEIDDESTAGAASSSLRVRVPPLGLGKEDGGLSSLYSGRSVRSGSKPGRSGQSTRRTASSRLQGTGVMENGGLIARAGAVAAHETALSPVQLRREYKKEQQQASRRVIDSLFTLGHQMQQVLSGICEEMQVDVQMRVGVHSGNVVTGIVGRMAPRFHVFGLSVIRAEHMEESGEKGMVHCSREAVEAYLASAYDFKHRELPRKPNLKKPAVVPTAAERHDLDETAVRAPFKVPKPSEGFFVHAKDLADVSDSDSASQAGRGHGAEGAFVSPRAPSSGNASPASNQRSPLLASARSVPLQPQEITARRAEEARPLLSPVHAQSPAPASPTTAPESVAPTEPGAPLQAGAARNRATSIGAMSGVSGSWAGMHARARSDSKTLSELASGHVRALRRQGS